MPFFSDITSLSDLSRFYFVLIWFCDNFFINNDVTFFLQSLIGGNIKTWKRRWFVLANQCLYYFQFAADKEPKGIIPLESDLRVRETDPANTTKTKPSCFEIYSESNSVIKACKTGSDGKVREGKHEIYRMCAPNDKERSEWIECIANAIRRDRTHLPGGPEIGDKRA